MPSRRSLRLIVPALVVAPALGWAMGGWAVTTVDDLPDYVVAGRPFALSYSVRQHGRTLLSGLNGTIEATSAGREVRTRAAAGEGDGHYVASLTLPQPGDWTITIHNGFANGSETLLPIKVIDAAARPPATATADRGHALFFAKGCVTCHVQIDVGPKLVGRRYDPELLSKFLADPKVGVFSRPTTNVEMPQLNLSPKEIAALVAYVNGAREVGGR